MRKAWFFCFLIPGLLAGCLSNPPVDALPEVSETLDAIGRRLSQSLSESRLTVLAMRGSELLTHLKARERDALGRGYLRFQCQGSRRRRGRRARVVGPVLDPRSGFRGHWRDAHESRRPLEPFPQGVSPRMGWTRGQWPRSQPAGSLRGFSPLAPGSPAASGGFDHAGPGVWEPLAQADRPGRRQRSAGGQPAVHGHSRHARGCRPAPAVPRSASLHAAGERAGLEDQGPLGGISRPGHDRVRIRSRPRAGLELANRARHRWHGHPDRPRAVRGGRERCAPGSRPDRNAGGARRFDPGSLAQPAQRSGDPAACRRPWETSAPTRPICTR